MTTEIESHMTDEEEIAELTGLRIREIGPSSSNAATSSLKTHDISLKHLEA